MHRMVEHLRQSYHVEVTARAAARLAKLGKNLEGADPGLLVTVTGFDLSAWTPRQLNLQVGELRQVMAAGVTRTSRVA